MKWLGLASLLVACNGDGTGNDGPFGNGNGNGNGNSDPDVSVPSRAADETYEGNLSSGTTLPLGWAESNFCWPATENVNFNGAHVITTYSQPRGKDLYIRVDPEAGVDVSVYTIQSTGSAQIPPNVTSPFSCDAMYDQTSDNNPGTPEILFLQNYLDFEVTIGIAGANGTTTGAYTVQIWEEQGAEFDTQ